VGKDAVILGAGIVGVSVATHLRLRGWDVVVVDRRGPGDGASFGNAGLIQREAVYPHGFPRAIKELARIARNVSIDAVYHPLDLPGLAAPLLRFWWASHPKRYARAVLGTSRLIETCVDEHKSMAEAAGARHMLRRSGWLRVFDDERALDETVRSAEASRRDHGVTFEALDGDGLAVAEPHLMVRRAGAVHFTNAPWVADPHALVLAYAQRLEAMGGRFATGDAMGLSRAGKGWRVPTADGVVEAGAVVVALGAHSARLTSRFGYSPPMFGERGYHMHYGMRGNAVLNHPMMDMASGFMLSPMRAGIRLATGAEFARLDSAATPVQLKRAEPVARKLLPLGERLQGEPWLGVRPCMPDMVPVISTMPKQAGMWGAFGHGSVGLTLGPSTGRLLAEMMDGAPTFIDPAPYRADRF
jgi:D-amino-acid dehydrogenase